MSQWNEQGNNPTTTMTHLRIPSDAKAILRIEAAKRNVATGRLLVDILVAAAKKIEANNQP